MFAPFLDLHEPPPDPARLLAAVGGLELGGVDEPEAAAGLGDEGVGDRVAGSWHARTPWYPPVATEKSGEPGKLLHPFAPVGGNPMDGMAFPGLAAVAGWSSSQARALL